MRTLLKVSVPVVRGNQAITDGTLARVLQDVLGKIRPEAVYFTTVDGKRGGFIVFDLTDPSQIPPSPSRSFRSWRPRSSSLRS